MLWFWLAWCSTNKLEGNGPELAKNQRQCNKLHSFKGTKTSKTRTSLSHVTSISTHRIAESRGPQFGSRTTSIRANLLTKINTSFWYVIDWSPQPIFQPLTVSENKVQRSSTSVISAKRPNHLSRFILTVYSKDWTVGPSILRLECELLMDVFHQYHRDDSV